MRTQGCLEPEVMAAYVDHGLSLAERAHVEAHLASCPQCTSLLAGVVRTVADVSAFIPDAGTRAEATPLVTRRKVMSALAAAAAVIAVLVAPSVVRIVIDDRDAGLVSLVDSVGEHRSVLGRLTGGFPHAPLDAPSAGGQDGHAAETDRVLLTSGEIRESFGDLQTPSRLHTRGVSQLLARRYDDAVQSLLAASREQPANAQYLSDVAAVHLERARLGLRPDDLPRALAAADRARRLDPSLSEAWFNRALALSQLSLNDQARTAWTEYLARDGSSAWATEARARLEEVSRPTAVAAWSSVELRLEQSFDGAAAEAAVRTNPTEARTYLETKLLPRWATALDAGRDGNTELDAVRLMADALARLSGDVLYADTVSAIQRTATRGRTALLPLARAHTQFAEGTRIFGEDRFQNAEPHFAAARAAFAQAGSPFAIRTDVELGAVAFATGRSSEALPVLSGAYAAAASRNYFFSAGRAAWFQGLVAFGQARLGDVQDRYEAALSAFQESNDAEQVAGAHNLLASFFLYLGDAEESWRHRRQALQGLAITRSPRLRYGLLVGAVAAVSRQDPNAALALQDSVLEAARAWGRDSAVAEAQSIRADLLLRTDRRDEARLEIDRAQQALETVNDSVIKNRVAVSLAMTESDMYRVEAPYRAIAAATRARALVDGRRDRLRLAQLNLRLAKASLAVRRLDDAEAALAAGMAAFDAERASLMSEGRLSSLDESWQLLDVSIELALTKGDYARAFELAERSRLRTVAESKSAIPSLSEAQRALREDEAILALNQFEDRLAVWLIRRDDAQVLMRPLARSDAERLLARQRDEVSHAAQAPAASMALYNEVLRPLAARLAGVSRLVVVPDATFADAPFAGLWNASRQRFLVEEFTLVSSPSASSFTRTPRGRKPAGQPSVLVVADASSRDTAKTIAAGYPSSRILTGESATKTQVLEDAGNHSVVHVSTRTENNASYPLLSRLQLSDEAGKKHSGTLLASEVAGHPFNNTQIVVVDDTGDATHRGKGTANIARAFMTAGVPAVLGTLSGASDSQTRELIAGFHRQVAAQVPADEALTEIQRNALQQNGRRLGAWSALVLYGSDR